MAKGRRGLDGRHRDRGGKIEKKHGNTRVASLRKEYGESFAKGHRKDMMLKTLLKETGTHSLDEYLKHSKRGVTFVTAGTNISLSSTTAISQTTELFNSALTNLAKK